LTLELLNGIRLYYRKNKKPRTTVKETSGGSYKFRGIISLVDQK